MQSISVRFTVSGRVQGVGFRAATAEMASSLGVSGWVMNLEDGRVCVVAEAMPRAIEALGAWLWTGPSAARVSGVVVEHWSGADIEPGFLVRGYPSL